jgi:hypothetical protein
MEIDKQQIIKALELWFQPGDVFEVRVLDATTADYMRPHVESGYFDFEHIEDAAEAIGKLRGYRGVYATVNPVNPALLARANNRLRAAGREPTTADADVLCRRWLLLDFDAKRPSGVSSTDKEHDDAQLKAMEIQEALSGYGWPEPLMLDSGNGAQLMYKIDLPSNDDNLVQNVLQTIAGASDEQVDIDVTVHNPARIWRIPGTMNCKGDSIESRPHRMANIVSVPEKLEIVPEDKLRGLLTPAHADSHHADHIPDRNTQSAFNIDEWITQYCPELGQPQPWKDGRRWVFDKCPFDPAHSNKSAVLIEQGSGAIAFTCHHNSCSGNNWFKLRELKEPGCYDVPQEFPEVNIDGILNQNKVARPEKREIMFPDPGQLPKKLLKMPGFVNEIVNLCMETAPYPNRVLAFTGALAFLAFLVGRKVQDKRDNRSNLYLIALAKSGTGKDHPRKVNFNLAHQAGVANCVGDAFASGAGLEDALFMHPSMLFQADEFDCIFNTMKYSKDGQAESINEKLLKFYGASNSLYPIRKKALAKLKNDGSQIEVNHIVNPNLVIMGTAIPDYFYESLTKRLLENGLAARCIIIEAGSRGTGKMALPISPSDSLMRAVKYLVNLDLGAGNLSHENPKPLIITETTDATKKIKEVQAYCDEQYHIFEKQNEAGAMALWARAHEKVCKLALLHGISSNIYEPVITEKSVKWALLFVEHLTKRALFMADNHVAENAFDEKCQKIVRYLRQAGGTIQHSKLLKRMREPLDMFKRIIETLQANGTLDSYTETGKGRPAVYYRLLE